MAETLKTGNNAPQTGMYKCNSCGEEINVNQGDHIPPCPKDANTEWSFSSSSRGRSSRSEGMGERSKSSRRERR